MDLNNIVSVSREESDYGDSPVGVRQTVCCWSNYHRSHHSNPKYIVNLLFPFSQRHSPP